MSSETVPPRSGLVPWSTLDAFIVIIIAFVIYLIGSIIVGIIDLATRNQLGVKATHGHIGFWVLPASYLFLTAATFLVCRWWLIGRRGATWSDLGFHLPPSRTSWISSLPYLIGIALVALVVVYVGEAVIASFFQHFTSFHLKGNTKELLPSKKSSLNVPEYLTLVGLAAVVAPVTEETLFRGVLFQGVTRDLRGSLPAVVVAALFSGLVFGLFHLIGGSGEFYTLPLLVFLGIVLASAFRVAGSLAGSMLVHASVNFISVTFLFAQHH